MVCCCCVYVCVVYSVWVQYGGRPGVACFDTYSRPKPAACLSCSPPGLALSLPCMIKENIEGELLLSNQALQQKHIHWRVNKHPDTDNSLAVLLHHLGPTLPTERGLLFLAWKHWMFRIKTFGLTFWDTRLFLGKTIFEKKSCFFLFTKKKY